MDNRKHLEEQAEDLDRRAREARWRGDFFAAGKWAQRAEDCRQKALTIAEVPASVPHRRLKLFLLFLISFIILIVVDLNFPQPIWIDMIRSGLWGVLVWKVAHDARLTGAS